MTENENKIVKYLRNRLPEADRLAFEEAIKNDPKLAEEVEETSIALAVLKTGYNRERKKALKALMTEHKPKPTTIFSRIAPYLAAASIALLLAFGIYHFYPTSSSELFADQYFKPFSIAQKSSDGLTATLQEKAYDFYNKRQYNEAIPILEQLYSDNSKNRLLAGIAFYKTGNYQKASVQFNKLIDTEDFLYKETGMWYEAINQLKQNNPSKAKNYLKTITPKSEYFSEAQTLLKKI